ncbi:MAG TPA: S-layer homology domain-containing protein [Tissierellia bacterium]|nr:S-layer homology domain-containing protein [Tissierellia bacterium]
MKKITIFTIITVIILSSLNIVYASSRNLRGKFTESTVAGTNFIEITLEPYYSNDDEERDYYIYLPSGYFVEGKSATFVADRNGRYPFTVYDGTYRKTFVHTVDSIEEPIDYHSKKDIYADFKLLYDYEKKQIVFNLQTDKLRTIKTPKETSLTNEINFYPGSIKNNEPYNLTVEIDDEPFYFKIIKSGEFYLLIYLSPVNYDDYSTIVEYYGYNFTNNEDYTTYPSKDIYDDNGNYEVLVKSNNSQHIFNINISDIDYRRPSVSWAMSQDGLTIEAEDDFELSYIITYDGKYVSLKDKTATYNHPEEIIYNGEYIFIVGDGKGNRTVEKIVIKNKRKLTTTRTRHAIELAVHDFKYTEELFKNKGIEYRKETREEKLFENILPAYMNGKSANNFSPDSSITRAEMVAIFCRLNDLPYDNRAHLKTKFTDIDNHWARDYISMGSSKRYISGYKDKTFKPDNPVTRAEFCQMLTKISTYKPLLNAIPSSTNKDYEDIRGHWGEKEIIQIAGKNLVLSDSEKFYPDKPITRGEVVYAINTLYGYNPTYRELAYINSLYNKYYNFTDIGNHKNYIDIIISVVGMYREVVDK